MFMMASFFGCRIYLIGLTILLFTGCYAVDPPACLMRAGDWEEVVESYDASPHAMELYNHMDVVLETWDSSATQFTWSGPANVLEQRWSQWNGNVLLVGYEDRCQWMRDLGSNLGLTIRTPGITKIALHGQGRLDATFLDTNLAVAIDAYAFAGYIDLHCELDSLTVRLHSGACIAQAEGVVGTIALFASGLSGIDAGQVQAKRAFINQSAHPLTRFLASEYAYIELNSHSDVAGILPMPSEYQVIRHGSGQLIWED